MASKTAKTTKAATDADTAFVIKARFPVGVSPAYYGGRTALAGTYWRSHPAAAELYPTETAAREVLDRIVPTASAASTFDVVPVSRAELDQPVPGGPAFA